MSTASARTTRAPHSSRLTQRTPENDLCRAHLIRLFRLEGIKCRKNAKNPTNESLSLLANKLNLRFQTEPSDDELISAILEVRPRTPEPDTTSSSTSTTSTSAASLEPASPTIEIESEVRLIQ